MLSTSRANKTLRPARAEKAATTPPTAAAAAEVQASPSRSLQPGAGNSERWEFRMDLLSGEMGYYTVDGMSGVLPTLTVAIGTTYILSQAHVTNWMHPIGLASQPDGAHDVLYAGTGGEGAPEVTDGSGTAGYVYMYYVKYPGATTFTAVTWMTTSLSSSCRFPSGPRTSSKSNSESPMHPSPSRLCISAIFTTR